MRYLYLILYYGLLRYLPRSSAPLVGGVSKALRYWCCKGIFAKCGHNVNIERNAFFGSGRGVEIGDNSGLGANCHIPSTILIGRDVMMAPECFILHGNHEFSRTDIPMIEQGHSTTTKITRIEDDVWIGRNVLMTPGRHIRKGSIIAAGCVLCKDFPEYSIVGGNPSRLIKSRLQDMSNAKERP